MAPTFAKATKRQAKLRMAIAGPSGSGKTYTALRIAKALGGRTGLIDTERGSASKYADEFDFDTLDLESYHPNAYIEAIRAAEQAGINVLIIDSATHEWSGLGGCLELVDTYSARKGGNKWAAWADVTPLHNAFIDAINQSKLHVITTFRSKMDYVQSAGANGKTEIKKVGMNPITREGTEYEYDVVGEIDLAHLMVISKTRCKELDEKAFRMVTESERFASIIAAWLGQGEPAVERPAKAPEPAAVQQAMPHSPATNGKRVASPAMVTRYNELVMRATDLGIDADALPEGATPETVAEMGTKLKDKIAIREHELAGVAS